MPSQSPRPRLAAPATAAPVVAFRRIAPLAILSLALALRVLGLNKGVWLDEHISIRLTSVDNFLQALRPYGHPPLYFALLRLWSHVGTAEWLLRIPSIVCGVATVAVLMRWIRSRSLLASLLAGFLCAILPLMLRYSQEIRQYQLLVLLTVLAFYFASQIIAEPQRRRGYVGLAAALTLAVTTHLIAAMVVTTVAVFIALSPGALKRIHFPAAAIAFGVPCAVFLLMYVVFLGDARERIVSVWWMPPLSVGFLLLTIGSVFGASQQLLDLTNESAQWLSVNPVLLDFVLIAGFVGCVAAVAVYGEWRETFPLFGAAGFYWLQIVLYSVFRLPILIDRTMLPSAIPLLAFAGLQTATIRGRALRAACCALLVLYGCILATVWIKRTAWEPIEACREVAQALATQWEEGAAAVFFPAYAMQPIAYYFPDLPPQAVTPIRTDADNATVVAQIAALEKGRGAQPVFLIVRWDPNVQKHEEVYRWLVTQLNARFGEPGVSQRFGILSLSKYARH